jgi:sec-independent protein translocase protein TatA
MGLGSPWHWILVAVVILLLFGGRGKISSLMGDFAEGIKAFKKGMQEDKPEEAAKEAPKTIDQVSGTSSNPSAEAKRTESRV